VAEQLWFTWTARGPTGRSGYQIVAASDGLSDDIASITQAALRYCTYPRLVNWPTGSPPPVSFGWADYGQWRIVFNRVATLHGPKERPEVFCAHVVVAPTEELPTSLIATWFDSRLWWTEDEGVYGRLDRLNPEHVEPGTFGPLDDEQHLAFIETLLTRRHGSLTLPFSPANVACLAASAENAVPGILEGSSLSTYEAKSKAGSFDIAGVGVTGHIRESKIWRRPDSDSPASRAAKAVIVGKLPNELTRTALTVARSGQVINRIKFIVAVDCLQAIDHNEEIEFSQKIPLLDSPHALAFVLSRSAGALMVSKALANDIDRAWEAIGASTGTVAEEYMATLGAKFGCLIADNNLTSRLGGYLKRAAGIPQQFANAIEATVLSASRHRPSLLTDVDPSGRLFLLRHLHHSGTDDTLADLLIKNVGTAGPDIAAADDLPAIWRGIAAAEYVSSGEALSPLIDLLSSDEEFAGSFAQNLPSVAPLLTLIEDFWWTEARDVALFIGPGLRQSDRFAVATAALDRMSVRRRIKFLTDYINRCGVESLDHTIAEWAALVSWLVARAVIERSLDTDDEIALTPAECALLSSVAGQRGTAWFNIDSPTDPARPVDLVRDTKNAFSDTHPTEQQAALVLAVERAIAECRTVAQIEELATALLGTEPSSYETCARNFVASALRQGSVPTRSAVLKYVMQLIGRRDIESDRAGNVIDQELHLLLRTLEESLSRDNRNGIRNEINSTKRVSKWWESVSGSNRPTNAF
jgi:hypothetical protein